MVRQSGPSVKPAAMPIRTAIARTDGWRVAGWCNKIAKNLRSGLSPNLEIETMPTHKFRIGQIVTYRPAVRGHDAPPGAYMIIARLPQSDDGQFEYHIRNLNDEHQRVAQESELNGR